MHLVGFYYKNIPTTVRAGRRVDKVARDRIFLRVFSFLSCQLHYTGISFSFIHHRRNVTLINEGSLTLRLLISYIYGASSKARNANVVYIWTYVWHRWNSLFLFAAQCFNTESMQRSFLCHICLYTFCQLAGKMCTHKCDTGNLSALIQCWNIVQQIERDYFSVAKLRSVHIYIYIYDVSISGFTRSSIYIRH